jgi:hypothetical protein
MADENPMDCPAVAASTAEEDAKTESAVLAFVLAELPAELTIPELSLALNAGSNSLDDAVERAVRELVSAGLLHCRGAFVLPTRAARCFERLERPE